MPRLAPVPDGNVDLLLPACHLHQKDGSVLNQFYVKVKVGADIRNKIGRVHGYSTAALALAHLLQGTSRHYLRSSCMGIV